MCYLIIINIIGLILFKIDKKLAIENKKRIPERVLIGIAIMGGTIGSFLGMIIFHHKNKRLKFKIIIPSLIIIWLIIILKMKGII